MQQDLGPGEYEAGASDVKYVANALFSRMSEEAGMAFGNSGLGREGRGCSSWGSPTASSRKKHIPK